LIALSFFIITPFHGAMTSSIFSHRQDPFHLFEEELTMTAQDIQMLYITALNILLMKENNNGV